MFDCLKPCNDHVTSTGGYNIPDLTGKNAIITGGNSGLGLKTALELARRGADVVITCRSDTKGKDAVHQIKSEIGSANVEYAACDLNDMATIKTFVESYFAKHIHLDIFVANAGVSTVVVDGDNLKLTKDGQEFMMQANHLGHFAMVKNLLPLLEKSEATIAFPH